MPRKITSIELCLDYMINELELRNSHIKHDAVRTPIVKNAIKNLMLIRDELYVYDIFEYLENLVKPEQKEKNK